MYVRADPLNPNPPQHCRPEALLFDCDGVLVDTEAEGHRVAFNEAFTRKGLDHQWGLEDYGVLLETGGGKERMDAYFSVSSASLFRGMRRRRRRSRSSPFTPPCLDQKH